MNWVDVTAEVPALRAEAAAVYGTNWNTVEEAHGAGAVSVSLGAWKVTHAELVLTTGLGLSIRDSGLLAMNAWQLPVEGGWRWSVAPETARLRGYWELGGGPSFYVVLVEHTPAQLDVGVSTHTGFGATFGRGPIRGAIGVRGRAALGLDALSGEVTTASGSTRWWWSPVSAQLAGYAGVSFR